MVKRMILVGLVSMVIGGLVWAVPSKMVVQGRYPAGAITSLGFSIGGSAWSETYDFNNPADTPFINNGVTIETATGIFTVYIGTKTEAQGGLPAAIFDGTERNLKVFINGSTTPFSTHKLVAVPYAYQANSLPGVTVSGGNVGIGTTGPGATLEVRGQIIGGFGAQTTVAAPGGALNWNNISNARSGSGYTLLYGNATHGPGPINKYFHPFSFEYNVNKNGTSSLTQFAIPYLRKADPDIDLYMRGRYADDATTWSPWRKILSENSSGNVGIGTTAPVSKLNINNGSLSIDGGTAGNQPANGARILVDAGVSTAHVLMKLRNNNVAALTVLGSGNVGIGTTAPGEKLSIVNGGQTINLATGANTSGYALNVGVNDDGVNFSTNSSSRGFNFKNAGRDLVEIQADGDVIIKNLSKGFVRSTETGRLYAEPFTSSRRFKKDIEPLGIDTNSVLKLEPVKFRYKKDNQASIGLIAEDVETVIPELVSYDEENKPLEVHYDKVSVYLLGVVKEQQRRMDEQQKELQDLKARIGAQEGRQTK